MTSTFGKKLTNMRLLSIMIVLVSIGARESIAAVSITQFPVTSEARLVLSSPIEKGVVGRDQKPDMLRAPAGVYCCSLETEAGVFFAAPDGMLSGKMGALKSVDGGIFIPKVFSSRNRAYLFTGTPKKVTRKEEFWQDLYVTEGCEWHIDAAGDARISLPDGWLGYVGDWVKELDGGKWEMTDHSEPVVRWSKPSGYLVTIALAPRSEGKASNSLYPQAVYCVILVRKMVEWSMLRVTKTKSGRFVTALPPDQFEWKPVKTN